MAQHAEHWALSVEQDLLAHPRAEALLCGFGFCHAGGGSPALLTFFSNRAARNRKGRKLKGGEGRAKR